LTGVTTVSDAAGDSPAQDPGTVDGAASPDAEQSGVVRPDHTVRRHTVRHRAVRLVAGSAALVGTVTARARKAAVRFRIVAGRASRACCAVLRVLARSGGPIGWRLVRGTTVGAFRYRVTGLAAEIAFFALLSLPPLALGLIGTMGHFHGVIGPDTVADVRNRVIEHARTVLTDSAVNSVVVPLIDDVIKGGSPDVVSISFVLSLWAGSRATNVCIDTITIAYGLSGIRGVIRTRTRAFLLYVLALMVAGPTLARQAVPESATAVQVLYWPVLVSLSIVFLALLYHMSVPVRTAWWREVPGAVVALVIWVVGSLFLRIYLSGSLSGVSVYGSLAAAIAVLAWLYVAALAVLIGATLNAEIDRLWPSAGTARARAVRAAREQDAAQAAQVAAQAAQAGTDAAEPGATAAPDPGTKGKNCPE
jgi:membrane protein